MPGKYGIGRPWDIVVVKDDVPLTAIIWKTIKDASITHNINNRIQELISYAFDVRTWLVRSQGVRPMRPSASARWAAMCLVAWAMLSQPVSLRRLIASERRLAMMRGVWPVRRWEASSA